MNFFKNIMQGGLIYGSYYFMLIICLLWTIHLWQYIEEQKISLDKFFRQNWQGILCALLLTTIVFISLKPDYRVLSDEANLLAVSKSMTYDKTIWIDHIGKWYYNEFHPLIREIPKRPFLFPFLASLLHTIFGYSRDNLFILNFLALFILLCLAYCFTKSALDKISGFAAMMLIISQPIVSLSATSAGFDLFCASFLAITLAALYSFVTKPSSASLAFLWCNLLVFSYIRYESLIYFVLIICFLALLKLLKKTYFFDFLYLYLLTPILFQPLIWQLLLCKEICGESYTEGTNQLFSINQIVPQFRELILNQFRFDYFLPYANIVNIIGFILLIVCLIKILQKVDTINETQKHYFIAVVLFLIVHNILYLAHYFGKYTHPASARFFIVLTLFLSLMPVIFWFIVKNKKYNTKILLTFAVISFVLYHPIGVQNRFFDALQPYGKTRYIWEFIKSIDNKEFLLIIDRPRHYTAENYGAVDFNYANNNAELLLSELSQNLYRQIIVVQEISFYNDQPLPNNNLIEQFPVKTIAEQKYTEDQYLRFSTIIPVYKP